jgi:hypothetical protein
VGEERTAATVMDGRARWGRRGLRISRSRGGVPHRTDTTARHGWKGEVGEAIERRPPWMEWRGGGGTDCEGGAVGEAIENDVGVVRAHPCDEVWRERIVR